MPIPSDGEIDLIIHNLFPIRVWTTCGPRIGADAAIVVGEPHLALNDTGVEFNDAVLPGASELAKEQQKKKNWHNVFSKLILSHIKTKDKVATIQLGFTKLTLELTFVPLLDLY